MADTMTDTVPDQATQQTAPPADAGTGYESAAQPQQNAQTTPPAQTPDSGANNVPTQNPTSNSTIAPAAAPDYQTPAVVLHPQQSPIAHAVQSVVDAIAGTTGAPKIATDSQGNRYVQDTKMTPGQQWRKIGGEVLSGAAAGLAAGKGAGNTVKAPLAGIEAQQANQKDADANRAQLTDEAQKENLQNANNQMLQMNMAHQAWDFTHHQIEATQHDIDFWNGQEDRLVKEGGRVLGTAAHNADIAGILHVQPDVMQQMVQNQTIKVIPNVDADGKPAGIKVIMMPGSYQKQVEDSGAKFPTFNKLTGEYDWHETSEPSTKGEIDAYWTAAAGDKMAFENQKAELARTQAQTGEANANASKAPSEIARNQAETSKVPSEINENNARATEARANADKAIEELNKLKTPAGDDPQVATLGESIARGTLTEDQISGFSKGTKTAVETYLAQHHPNLDQKSVFLDSGERKQVNLANNAIHNLDVIQAQLQRRPDLLGKINGLISQGKELTGTDDGDLTSLNTELDNYGLASTGAHGVKAVQARADAKKALLNGFKNGPNGVQSSIGAARMSLKNLASAGTPRGTDGNPYVYNQNGSPNASGKAPVAPPAGAPAGATQIWHDASGKLLGYTVNGKYQAAGTQ